MFKIPFLILGFTGPVGSGCTTLAKHLKTFERYKRNNIPKLLEETKSKIGGVITQINNATEEKENLFNSLEKYLEKKICLETLQNIEDRTIFQYISMSTVIIKLAITQINTPFFEDWRKDNLEFAEKLLNFSCKWENTISSYDGYSDFSKENYPPPTLIKDFETLWSELDNLRESIANDSLITFLNNEMGNKFCLQIFGNNLRGTGNAFKGLDNEDSICNYLDTIADETNRLIKFYRHNPEIHANIFLIDALRNPAEVEFFKRYDSFYLISIHADQETRFTRIKKKFDLKITCSDEILTKNFKQLDRQDSGPNDMAKNLLNEQNISRCDFLADIALINNGIDKGEISLLEQFMRYMALVVSPGIVQPNREEAYMDLAYSLSLRSTCISRQVGAVITDDRGSIIGLGWNDVGSGHIGCGLLDTNDYLYSELPSIQSLRSFIGNDFIEKYINREGLSMTDSLCFKDILAAKKMRDKALKVLPSIIRKKVEENNLKVAEEQVVFELAEEIATKLEIKKLEYCRALHAEENALLQIAIRGGTKVYNGVIFTTTFPCELCAKKLYQSGINRIYYTEPYPENMSEGLFLNYGTRKIELIPFQGVKSSGYFRLFRPRYNKKEAQRLD